ncbi:MAG: hypothetical protein D6719_13955 [Candidatus Dadabacteria bacterium]|nr:MAG: hypothetical protein D6719_13955 [Candidatus Dadabacteria bacterium]
MTNSANSITELKNLNLRDEFFGCINTINSLWSSFTFKVRSDWNVKIGLPNKFVSPNNKIFKEDQFYWDTYFTILGLVVSDRIELARGMVENLFYLLERFGVIPLRNRYYNLGLSQPPFLSSMVFEIFDKTRDKNWLKKGLSYAEKELLTFWCSRPPLPEHKLAYRGLSRYCDHFICHATAEHESGWDSTSRFYDRCLDFLPVDLNACLYKYEKDLSRGYNLLGNPARAKKYAARAARRKKAVMDLMWDPEKGFFFDYDYTNQIRSTFYSLAGFYPLWAGMLDEHTATRVVKKLSLFEFKGGLANTARRSLRKPFRQWDYPNGWPGQQWIVIKGLINYGFFDRARRLGYKWLNLNRRVFQKTGKFWEKYDVIDCAPGKSGRYPTQSGFAWTNSVFLRLIHDLEEL